MFGLETDGATSGASQATLCSFLCRSGRVLELLASGLITGPQNQLLPGAQQHWPTSAEVYSSITHDAAHCPDQAAAGKGACTSSDASTGMQQQGRTASSSSCTSSAADGDSNNTWQPDANAAAAMQTHHNLVGMAPAHSAYFPAMQVPKQQQPQHSCEQQQPCTAGQQQAQHGFGSRGGSSSAGIASTPLHGQGPAGLTSTMHAAPAAAPVSSSTAGAPATWQESLQSGLFAKLAQQGGSHAAATTHAGSAHRQEQYNTPPKAQQRSHAAAAAAPASAAAQRYQQDQYQQEQHQQRQEAFLHTPLGQQHGINVSTGFEVEGGLLSTSTSSQSAQSELLDSDDLDELAGLCDTLLQRHATQPQEPAAAALPGEVRATPQQQRQQHKQQGLAGTAWFGSLGADQAYEQAHQHTAMQDVASQACAPGLQALAAQLRQLQEQVSATVMDAAPARSTSSTGGSFRASTPTRQASAGAGHARHEPPSSMQEPQRRRGSTGSCNAGSSTLQHTGQTQHSHQEFGDSPAMTTLQQQLAQRMQEVKERLSNICNGMMQDDPDPAHAAAQAPIGNIQSSNSFFSPPASPPAEHMATAPRRWDEHVPAASAAGAGAGAGTPAPAGSHGTKHGRATAGKSPLPNAAGKLGSGWSVPGMPTTGCHAQVPPGSKVGSSKQAHAAAHSRGTADPTSAAAFAAIKASIHSSLDVPGFFGGPAPAQAAAAPAGGGRCRVDGQPSVTAASRAPAQAPAHGSSIPAAAGQGSRASAEDAAAATEDSEGSWATVSESEQEAYQHTMNEQRTERTEHVNISTAGSRSGSSLDSSPNSTFGIRHQSGVHDSSTNGQQQQGQEQVFAQQSRDRMPGQHTPQRACQESEQAASPISCESNMLAGAFAARVPAEVVFSPMKRASSKGQVGPVGSDTATPLRQRNV